MKKICLIGKLNTIGNDIYDMLSRDYQVQLGGEDAGFIEGILQFIKPDLILICTSDMDGSNQDIFTCIQKIQTEVPVICVGSREEIAYFEEYMEEDRTQVIFRPVTNAEIRSHIYAILGVPASTGSITYRKNAAHIPNRGGGPKKIIQLIDDSKIQLRMMQSLLSKYYEVYAAESTKAAWGQMEKIKPDLILLDYDMPVCDGRETFDKLKEDERYRDIPVIFLTGVNERQRIQAVLAMEPAGYLLKPVTKDKLLEMTRQVLDR